MKKSALVLAACCVIVAAVALMLWYAPKPPQDSITWQTTTLPAAAGSYISCGCGCCGFDKPLEEVAEVRCLDKLIGERIEDKIAEDSNLSAEYCATAGCSLPVKYMYCD